MKRSSVFAILLAFVCILGTSMPLALGETAQLPETTFYFGGPNDDTVYADTIVLSSGNILLCCTTRGLEEKVQARGMTGCQAWLLCLTPQGEVAWQYFFGEDGISTVAVWPVELADGTLSLKYHKSKKQVMFEVGTLRLTQDGTFISQEKTADDEWPKLFPAGTGYLRQGGSYGDGFYYEYYTADGDVLWRISSEDALRTNLAQATDAGLLLTGVWDDPETHVFTGGISMVSQEGQKLWDGKIADLPSSFLRRTLPTADGGYLSCGRADQRQGLLVKWDAQGKEEWQKLYSFESSKAWGFLDMAETAQGYAALYLDKTDTQYGIMLFTKDGGLLAQGQIDRRFEQYSGLTLTSVNGSAWLVGLVERDGQRDIWVSILDMEKLLQACNPQLGWEGSPQLPELPKMANALGTPAELRNGRIAALYSSSYKQ